MDEVALLHGTNLACWVNDMAPALLGGGGVGWLAWRYWISSWFAKPEVKS